MINQIDLIRRFSFSFSFEEEDTKRRLEIGHILGEIQDRYLKQKMHPGILVNVSSHSPKVSIMAFMAPYYALELAGEIILEAGRYVGLKGQRTIKTSIRSGMPPHVIIEDPEFLNVRVIFVDFDKDMFEIISLDQLIESYKTSKKE